MEAVEEKAGMGRKCCGSPTSVELAVEKWVGVAAVPAVLRRERRRTGPRRAARKDLGASGGGGGGGRAMD